MSDKYQNPNKSLFTMNDLPLTIFKPTDGTLTFYGWYFNNDTSEETLEITADMEGVGYDDIGVSGYFSDKIMCAIRFDANGHDDYFENLASFNTVSNDPKTVALSESLYDNNPTKEFYLIGWEDSNGNLFPDTYKVFETETLVLKAKWGNKTIIEYEYEIVGENNDKNSVIGISNSFYEYYKPSSSFLLKADGFESEISRDGCYSANYQVSSWSYEGVNYEIGSLLTATGERMKLTAIMSKIEKFNIYVSIANEKSHDYYLTINGVKFDKPSNVEAYTGDKIEFYCDWYYIGKTLNYYCDDRSLLNKTGIKIKGGRGNNIYIAPFSIAGASKMTIEIVD